MFDDLILAFWVTVFFLAFGMVYKFFEQDGRL